MKHFALLSILLLFALPGLAQKKITLSGYMRDAQSGEALVAATVYIKELNIGVQTNSYGFYSISMPQGAYTAAYSYVGYTLRLETMQLIESRTYNADMQPQQELEEVEVKASSRTDENVNTTEMGTVTLSVDKIKTLPVLFGEVDVLKALQLMPGVQSAGEGNSGFYVRGGGPDQNLVLLDDAVVYNPGHLFGFFSVFNSDAVKNISLIKGSMPANYGGRLSSVVDVSMKEGNLKEYHAEGGIGLIASRLTIEGPIEKHKGSFVLSGRRTYIDVLIKPFAKGGEFEGSGYYFYDANLKANYFLGKKDRLYLSGYFGRDKFTFRNSGSSFNADIPWGNSTATLRWNHLFSDRLFMNASAIYNEYQFAFGGSQNDFEIKLSSGIKDWNGKVDFDYYTSFNHHIKFGGNYTYHKFIPNQVSGRTGETTFNPNNALIKYAHEAGVYVLDDFDLGDRIRVNAGFRYSWFGQSGPYWHFVYDINNDKTDSTYYGGSQIVKAYGGLEPRINIRYRLDAQSSIKASAVKSYQYIHLVTNNGTTLPTDLWVPSTLVVRPQEAWQYALGYFRNFMDNKVEGSVEVYYKKMQNQIEYRPGYTPTNVTRDQELDFVFGQGEAYGAEFFLNKTKGRFTGWIGYTLSWTYRKFGALNNGDPYPAKYDRRHDISVVGTYEVNKKWTLSSVFIYGSGNAITLPTNYYFIEQQVTPEYSGINQYRIFPYHRLDLSAIYKPKPKKLRRWESSWAFSIYNVYSRQNPYFLYVDTRGTVSGGVQAKVKQVSIFPILPAITYNFRF
jgi:hypothetical protein